MLRLRARVITLAVILVGRNDGRREARAGFRIIVNFTKQTVHGFGFPGMTDYPVNITGANEVTVAFAGRRELKFQIASTMGSIDRVTGDLEATLL